MLMAISPKVLKDPTVCLDFYVYKASPIAIDANDIDIVEKISTRLVVIGPI